MMVNYSFCNWNATICCCFSLGGYEVAQSAGQDSQYLPAHCSQTQDGRRKNRYQAEDERVHQRELLCASDTS